MMVLHYCFMQGNHEILLRCIKENLGFKDGKPVAACIIYKCLKHWRSFESERTAIFDHVIEAINDVLKVQSFKAHLFCCSPQTYHLWKSISLILSFLSYSRQRKQTVDYLIGCPILRHCYAFCRRIYGQMDFWVHHLAALLDI